MAENDFSIKVRTLRAKHGLTLEQVAKHVGVGSSTVRKWETGMIENIRRDKIAKLSEALHTTPSYLMGWEDKQENSDESTTANRIYKLMIEKSISYSQLAESTNIPKSALQKYVTGNVKEIPIERIQLIATALGVDPYSLADFDSASQMVFERINDHSEITNMLDQLNDIGLQKAKERIEELLEVPKYRLDK